MDNYLLVYLWTRLPYISYLFFISLGLLLIIFIAYLILRENGFDIYYHSTALTRSEGDRIAKESNKNLAKTILSHKLFRFITYIFITTSILMITIPNKQDILLIYLLPKVYSSKGVQDSIDILNNIPQEVREYIKSYINIPN